jgi:hypothetical protein
MIDNSNIKIISHIWIRDPDSDVTLLKQRDVTIREEIARPTAADKESDDHE